MTLSKKLQARAWDEAAAIVENAMFDVAMPEDLSDADADAMREFIRTEVVRAIRGQKGLLR